MVNGAENKLYKTVNENAIEHVCLAYNTNIIGTEIDDY